MQSQDEVAKLKAEIERLRHQQSESQQHFATRLAEISEQLDNLSSLQQAPPESGASTPYIEPDTYQAQEKSAQTIADLGLHIENGQLIYHKNNQSLLTDQAQQNPEVAVKTKRIFTTHLSGSIIGQFSELVGSPFTPLFNKLNSFYSHYQQRGLAAVFLMTIAGIITLTLGFTYLLQYSLIHWLSEIGKVSFAFVAANTLLALGVYLYKRRTQMHDFASSLVGLGLIINYVSAYFSGPYFSLIPDWLSLLVLLVITVFGFFISFKLETKVVAALSLLGGSLAPIMLFNAHLNHDQLIYLPYLLLIGVFAVLQGRLLRWPVLTELTAFLHIACVELFIISQAVYFEQLSLMPIIGLLAINMMFYIYGFSGLYWLKEGSQKQLILNKRLLVVPIALFILTIVSMVQLSVSAGYIFLVNALIFSVIYRFFNLQHALKVLALFFAGSFAGFAALVLLEQQLLGIVLFAEGIALLYLGCKAFYRSVRYESYVLILLGLVSHSIAIYDMINLSHSALSNISEYGVVVVYLALSATTLYILSHLLTGLIDADRHIRLEVKLMTFFRECLSVNYIALIFYISAIIYIDYALNIIPLISLLLLFLAKKYHLTFSAMLAWALLVPLIGLIALGILDVGNARFSMQPLYAQLARIELFICFIGFYYWYKHFHPQSKAFKLARFFQVGCFFILPLLFLPKVMREYPQYLSLALWLSVMISMSLTYLSRHRLLFLETKLVFLCAVVVTAIGCLQETPQAMLALAIAGLLLAYLQVVYVSLASLQQLICRFLWLLTPYYFALITAVAVHSLMSVIGLANWGIVMAAIVVYFTQLLKIRPTPLVLCDTYKGCLLLLLLPISASLLLHFEQGVNLTVTSLLYMLAQVIILASLWQLVTRKGCAIRILSKILPLLYIEWCWHILLSFCYLLWSYQFSAIVAAPLSSILLVLHGSCLMFVSLKVHQSPTIKLAGVFFALACSKVLFVDMVNFLIVQKVIAFMVIGGILLTVSYFYQKVKNRL